MSLTPPPGHHLALTPCRKTGTQVYASVRADREPEVSRRKQPVGRFCPTSTERQGAAPTDGTAKAPPIRTPPYTRSTPQREPQPPRSRSLPAIHRSSPYPTSGPRPRARSNGPSCEPTRSKPPIPPQKAPIPPPGPPARTRKRRPHAPPEGPGPRHHHLGSGRVRSVPRRVAFGR